MSPSLFEALVGGAGAIGSRVEAAVADPAVGMTFADNQQVLPENLGVGRFGTDDLHREKARVLAARRSARGGSGRALCGEVAYTIRPGLIRCLDAVLLCLDNPSAIRDVAEAVWAAGVSELPVLTLSCGGDRGGYQARVFVAPGVCPVCLFGEAEYRADQRAGATSCADTSAPRAAAAAAEAAARLGAEILARWREGDRGLTRCRVQCEEGTSGTFIVRLPAKVSARCPVPHTAAGDDAGAVKELGGSIASLTVGMLAEAALRCAGDDAEIVLGRRSVPLSSLYCPRCRAVASAPPLLMPAAVAAWRTCDCGVIPRPLAQRNRLSPRALLASAAASRTLAAWGAGHGDEFLVQSGTARVRLRCTFSWSDLDDC